MVKTALPMQGIWDQSLVGEQIPHAVGPKKRERERMSEEGLRK